MKTTYQLVRSFTPTHAVLCFMSLMALLASSCASLKYDHEKVTQTKKAAIIGFAVEQQVPDAFLDIMLGNKDAGGMPMAEFCDEKKHATQIYSDLAAALKQDYGLKVIDRDTVISSKSYQAAVKRFTEGWQARPPARPKTVCSRAEKVLDPFPIRNLKLEERDQIMSDLGVDRVIIAEVQTTIENTNFLKGLVGAADFATQAVIGFHMYEKGSEDPIWSDNWAEGKQGKDTVGSVIGITDQDRLDGQTIASSKTAYQALFSRAKKSLEK